MGVGHSPQYIYYELLLQVLTSELHDMPGIIMGVGHSPQYIYYELLLQVLTHLTNLTGSATDWRTTSAATVRLSREAVNIYIYIERERNDSSENLTRNSLKFKSI